MGRLTEKRLEYWAFPARATDKNLRDERSLPFPKPFFLTNPGLPMPDEPTELAVGESMVTSDDSPLRVETTRTEEHLFTTTYTDPETGALRLALQVDITTGETAVDPRHMDRSFWTVVADGTHHSGDKLETAIRNVPNAGIEVKPEDRQIRVYSDND